jgi:hypothetical protein
MVLLFLIMILIKINFFNGKNGEVFKILEKC